MDLPARHHEVVGNRRQSAAIGAELLSPDAPRVVGISEETVCYVSLDYFAADDPFANFTIHEAAHM